MVSIRDAMPSYVRQAYEEVEKLQRINGEIENGEFLRVVELRKANGVKYVGRLGEVLKAGNKKKSKPFLDEIDDLNFQSAILEREVRKAIEKAKKLKTERVEVVKTMPKKPDANDVIVDVVHGRVKGYDTVRRLIENAER
jgi:hypothetical protein